MRLLPRILGRVICHGGGLKVFGWNIVFDEGLRDLLVAGEGICFECGLAMWELYGYRVGEDAGFLRRITRKLHTFARNIHQIW